MTNCADANSDENSEAGRFLERDFNQCFEQMRHYDNQLWQICKFAFTGYTATIGAAVGLYQFSVDKEVDLFYAVVALLAVGGLIGLFFVALTVRNRAYYVLVTRYINEHRKHFLTGKPLGFENVTRMYTNPKQPAYFNWRSSQAWFLYIVTTLNSVLIGLLTFTICKVVEAPQWPWAVGLAIVALVIQLLLSIVYLTSREGKGAGKAVFGRA